MDRRRCAQYECSKRTAHRCLSGAASQGRYEPATRDSAFLENEICREDRRWPPALHLDCLSLAEASAAYRRQLTIDTTLCRTEMLGDLTANYNGIPRSYYRFGTSWPHVRETLMVVQEQDGDLFAVMIPTAEIVRLYYAPSTRLGKRCSGESTVRRSTPSEVARSMKAL